MLNSACSIVLVTNVTGLAPLTRTEFGTKKAALGDVTALSSKPTANLFVIVPSAGVVAKLLISMFPQ